MAEKAKSRSASSSNELATVTTEIATQIARSAAGELVKGQQPLGDVARKVAAETVETLDKRGPVLAEEAGIMTWRYAALGWITWQVGKRVVKRKAKAALPSSKPRGSRRRPAPSRNRKRGGSDG
jgi:thymidine phosphorylase